MTGVDDETNIMNISSVYLLLTLKCVIIHLYLNVLFFKTLFVKSLDFVSFAKTA